MKPGNKTSTKSHKPAPEYLRKIASRAGKIGGKARMASMTGLERSLLASKGGKAGSKARAESLTPEERRATAKAAALARWNRH